MLVYFEYKFLCFQSDFFFVVGKFFALGKYICAVKGQSLLEEIAILLFENIIVFCFVDNFTKFCLPSNYAKGLQRPDRGVVPVCTDCYFAVGRITLYSQEYNSIVW